MNLRHRRRSRSLDTPLPNLPDFLAALSAPKPLIGAASQLLPGGYMFRKVSRETFLEMSYTIRRHAVKASRLLFVLPIAAALVPAAFASGPYKIGSANTVTADPNIPRPYTKPCVVQLFSDAQFFEFNNENFTFTPPADCPGPWAKVVFESDISVQAGIQYDRTANYWIGPYNIYFGTTAEPSAIGPSWHVESDLTDYSAIFATSQPGVASIGNTLCCGLTSIIFASADIEFYPLVPGQTAPVAANVVLPLSAGPTGGTVGLNSTSSTLAGNFTLPTNIQNAYLDIYSQSQANDEFWYTCDPNDVAGDFDNCGNTGFRETEVTIDGTPAGVAPVSPWIYTGGIDPWLWYPIPGIQTLNFIPYRVDLTPFAGLLSNGEPHTVSVSVFNANGYFSDTANLLLYLDAGSTSVTGAVTRNTLTAPNPIIDNNLNFGSTAITGTLNVTSNRSFVVSGYVNTSHGKVTTTISQAVNFANDQTFDVSETVFVQNIKLTSSVNSTTTVAAAGQPTATYTRNYQFPLTLDLSEIEQPNGNYNLTTKAWQNYEIQDLDRQGNATTYVGVLSNSGQHQDTLEFDSGFNLLGNTRQSASQTYNQTDSNGVNVFCTVAAANNILTSYTPTCAGFGKF
jgi:hypothetical protein